MFPFLVKIEKLYNCVISEKSLELEFGIQTTMATIILITTLAISYGIDYYIQIRKTHIS